MSADSYRPMNGKTIEEIASELSNTENVDAYIVDLFKNMEAIQEEMETDNMDKNDRTYLRDPFSVKTNKHERMPKEVYYLGIAEAVAKRSTCLKRKYGAVIVANDEIIATGYNGSPRGEGNCCDIYDVCPRKNKPHNSGDYSDCPAVHAEQNAIISASRKDLKGSTLYLYAIDCELDLPVTGISPCPICQRMIKNAGITRVVTVDSLPVSTRIKFKLP